MKRFVLIFVCVLVAITAIFMAGCGTKTYYNKEGSTVPPPVKPTEADILDAINRYAQESGNSYQLVSFKVEWYDYYQRYTVYATVDAWIPEEGVFRTQEMIIEYNGRYWFVHDCGNA
ncbi:MAG: hypothetical protein PHN37_02000 [Candidatus Pacebacteria bacterium]|nr:hypothetical protein [Candidatus Paceibacterota bacterium]